jgi:hypothetical protein
MIRVIHIDVSRFISGEKYITSSHSSEAPPLPMSKPPEIMKDKEIEREMDEQSLQSEPYVDIESQENKTKELEKIFIFHSLWYAYLHVVNDLIFNTRK